MKKSLLTAGILIGALGLSGCAHYQPATGEAAVLGTVLGGVGGGLLGSTIGSGTGQVVAAAGGAILGAVIGNQVGSNVDANRGSCGGYNNCSSTYSYRSSGSCGSAYSNCGSNNRLQYSECADVRPCKTTPRCGQTYRMNEMDRAEAHRAFRKAAECEIGHEVYWKNSPTGTQGSIRPIADGMNAMGLYCREFQTTIYVDGRAERMNGKACRTRDGRWVPVF